MHIDRRVRRVYVVVIYRFSEEGLLREISVFEKGTFVNGRYEVQSVIGSGGTSMVYLVIDRHIGRSLAMKVMAAGSLGALRFARSEIESLRRVKFPLFPAIHDAFCDGRYIYILSEYVKGIPLSQLCKDKGLPRNRSLAIAQHIAEALDYLHNMSRPLLYLDLKPENIIISDDGLPHLIDFGIAGWLAARHIPVGTRGYSPPEQYDPDSGMDARTDIFAFGMTYYCIRSGIPPDPDIDTALYDISHSRILGSSERSFLRRCCAPVMDERYSSTREVIKQIRQIRSIPDRLKKRIAIAAMATGILILTVWGVRKTYTYLRAGKSARDLILCATQHMEDGEYTAEGIKMIKAGISSGELPESCEQEFIFEVAVNSMLIARDYRTAAVYFSKLDPEKYPEAADYTELCRMQSGFGTDSARASELIGKMYADIAKRAPSKMKYENLIFIAGCFENYDPDPIEGVNKALAVLMNEKEELESIENTGDGSFDEGLGSMKSRIDELIEVKKRRIATRKR